MTSSLRTKTVRGLLWSMIDWCGVWGTQFVIGIILARLLGPKPSGLIGMLTIFMALARSFLDSGFGSALIQKQDATETDNCSIFYFNIIVGLVGALSVCLAAPWIADFYKTPLLTPLCRLLSLNIVINSLGLVRNSLMMKHVDFKTQAKIGTISAVISGVIGVVLAMCGFGVWSLAIQSVTSNLCRTALLWVFNTWRPSLIFSFTALRRLFAFGSRMLASGLLNTTFENIYLVVIGKLFSPADVGYFSRHKVSPEFPPRAWRPSSIG